MGIAAFTIVNLLLQLLVPLLILGARQMPASEQSYAVLYAVKPPIDTRIPERWTDRVLALIRSDKDIQKDRLDVFPTRESAEEFCNKFSQAVRNEGWTLERCDMLPSGGMGQP